MPFTFADLVGFTRAACDVYKAMGTDTGHDVDHQSADRAGFLWNIRECFLLEFTWILVILWEELVLNRT